MHISVQNGFSMHLSRGFFASFKRFNELLIFCDLWLFVAPDDYMSADICTGLQVHIPTTQVMSMND